MTLLTSNQVAEQCGVTLRQLQCWREERLVVPWQSGEGSGKPCRYSQQDVFTIQVIDALIKFGISRHELRLVLRSFRRKIAAEPVDPSDYMVGSGRRWWIKRSPGEVIEFMKMYPGGCIVLALADFGLPAPPAAEACELEVSHA